MIVKEGQKVRFDPCHHIGGYGSEVIRGHLVTGTVVMVNEAHRWFSVGYGDSKQRMSFKFDDIGQVVKVIG